MLVKSTTREHTDRPLRVILDTDPGVDDALAILLALQSPELEVVAITTVCGNVPVERGTTNLFKVLSLMRPNHGFLIGQGASRPLQDALETATHVHGPDGLGELDRFRNEDGTLRYPEPMLPRIPSAQDVWNECIDRNPDSLTLITVGPLTNLAQALRTNHAIVRKLRSVISMGGAITVPGNVSPAAEFNIFVDPHAAQLVFNSGLRVTLIPLDVTMQVRLSRGDVGRMTADTRDPIRRFFRDSTEHALKFSEQIEGQATIPLHDPLAVGVATDHSLVQLTPLHVEVETEDRATRGMTLADRRAIRVLHRFEYSDLSASSEEACRHRLRAGGLEKVNRVRRQGLQSGTPTGA